MSFVGAAQMLRPPARGPRAHLRGHERRARRRSSPARLTVRDGRDPGARGRSRRRARRRRERLHASLPGLVDCHTHLPFAGWRAGEYERSCAASPTRRSRAAAAGSPSSARALRESSDEEVLAQSRGARARDARRRDDDVRVQVGLRPLARGRAARAGARRASWTIAVAQTTVSTALLAHAVPDGYTADAWMDEVRGDAARGRSTRRQRHRAGHLRGVDRVHATSTSHGWASWRRAAGLALRCHVEQFGDHALGAGGARGGRALGRPPLADAPRRHRARSAAAHVRGGAAPGRRVPRRRAPRARRGRCSTRARSSCSPPTSIPGTSPVRLDAAGDRARRRACTG